jgi:hypothetical protein
MNPLGRLIAKFAQPKDPGPPSDALLSAEAKRRLGL